MSELDEQIKRAAAEVAGEIAAFVAPFQATIQYGEFTTDPMSGLQIPKTLAGNLKWRQNVLRAAGTSTSVRRQVTAASHKSPIYWLNLFGWTYVPKRVDSTSGATKVLTDKATHVPFVTWRVQDEALQTLHDCILGGKDALINKARDMGASWLSVAIIQWMWQFRGSTSFLELSRKEGLVDRKGSMDSLFEKHRYLLKWQPEWLTPKNVNDTYMHLENRDNGSVIEGESTNDNAGQASRSTAILLDEFARVPNGEAIDLATADTTACRIFNSTPGAPNAQFTKIYRQKRAVIIELPWWRHPQKGANLKLVPANDVKGKGANLPLPPKLLGSKWVTPWYVTEDTRRPARDVAQNIDMEHGRVGDMIFDTDEVNKHREAFARVPDAIGTIRYPIDIAGSVRKALLRTLYHNRDAKVLEVVHFTTAGGSLPWRLWTPLVEYTMKAADGSMVTVKRPPQDTRYVFGIDVAAGTGSSNSVVTVKDHISGRIVAKFWDAYTTPEALAEIVVWAAMWFGGKKTPYIVFEKNGPGMQLGKKLVDLGYPTLYYQRADGTKSQDQTKRWGWHSSNQRKELLVGEYREALKTGKIINPCHEALDEALDYSYDDTGKIIPGSSGGDEGGATATHGDHVIADALCVLGSADLPAELPPEEPRHAPFRSFKDRARGAIRRGDTEKKAWGR